MARIQRSSGLETRTARLRLKVRRKPYFVGSGKEGVHLGYRRNVTGSGSWVMKRYTGRDDYGKYETETFAQADDYADSDGTSVLTYFEAMRKVGGELSDIQRRDRYTANDAVTNYVAWLKLHRKNPRDAEIRLHAYFLPYFDGKILSDLSPSDFEKWLAWATEHKPKGRKKNKPIVTTKSKTANKSTAVKPVIEPAELARRRRATINRTINTVKACLNRAFLNGHVSSDSAWKRLRKFKSADAARLQWLTVAQSQRLINACSPDFRRIVQAALLTGARWGELRALKVRHYDDQSGTIYIAESKSGKPRRIPLTDEGRLAFDSWTAGRDLNSIIFTDKNSNGWGSHDQHRPMKAACEAAKIEPGIGIHALRHTYASSLVQAGVSLAVIAEALGHSDTRMVSKHYGHLAPSHVADAIRAHLPTLGIEIDEKVRKVR